MIAEGTYTTCQRHWVDMSDRYDHDMKGGQSDGHPNTLPPRGLRETPQSQGDSGPRQGPTSQSIREDIKGGWVGQISDKRWTHRTSAFIQN